MSETLSNHRTRDAVMLYATQILKLNLQELAFITRVVYSPTFLVALTVLRVKIVSDDIRFYSLDSLRGVRPPEGEDEETLGDKLVEWVNETLEEYRKPIEE